MSSSRSRVIKVWAHVVWEKLDSWRVQRRLHDERGLYRWAKRFWTCHKRLPKNCDILELLLLKKERALYFARKAKEAELNA